jgi:hypothetical protein
MPNTDDDENVLYTHLLKEVKQLLTTTFFSSIIKTFNQESAFNGI